MADQTATAAPTVIKFGTDGWRALIAEDYTFDNVRLCAASVCRYLRARGLADRGLIVGYDTRFASEDFAEAVAEVAAADGIRVALSDRFTPTPVISYSIIDRAAGGGVVITASHNPWRWNGFKYKPEYGGSASPEVVEQIEAPLAELARAPVERMDIDEAKRAGVVETFDARAPYLAQLARLVDIGRIKAAGLRVAYDAMYGTGAGYLAALLDGGPTTVTELHGERNPLFPGIHAPEPIGRNLDELCGTIAAGGFDAGIATDGDSDRVGIVDERGTFINQLQVFALLVYYMLETRGERGDIVKSVTTTRMVQRLGELYGVPVHETMVGFKFLGPKMMETDALIGGEESGGYGFRGHVPERDGILAALYLLDFMARTGKRPSELLAELYEKVGEHHYDRIDVTLREEQREAIRRRAADARPNSVAGLKVSSTDTTDGYRFMLEDRGWLLLRFSGTEPLVRIYTEIAGDASLVPKVLAAGREIIGV